MSAPAKVITNGTSPTLSDWNFFVSSTAPDEVSFTARDCPAMDTYTIGTAVPGYSALHISETRPRLVPGSLYDISCRARGLVSGTSRVISRRKRTSADGWDEIHERRMEFSTVQAAQFGTPLSGNSQMFLMGLDHEEMLDLGTGGSAWFIRDLVFRGIDGGSYKLTTRRITVNENIVSPSDPIIVNLTGGWADARQSQVSFPRIVVEDTVLTTSAPPTTSIPGFFVPQNPPAVQSIPMSGADLTYNWPHHWKLASINNQELFRGAGVHQQGLTYEYVWPTQF